MNQILFFLFILCTIVQTHLPIYADKIVTDFPSETIILTLPEGHKCTWKEISRQTTKTEGIVELIPSSQTVENWTDRIRIQAFDRSSFDPEGTKSLDCFLDTTRKSMIEMHKGSKVTWKIIKKNKTDAIFEWTLHEPFQDVPPQNEIARVFLTKTGFHRIGITYKKHKIPSEKKKTWIEMLKKSTCVKSMDEARTCFNALSLLRTLPLAPFFRNWDILDSCIYQSNEKRTSPNRDLTPLITEGDLINYQNEIMFSFLDTIVKDFSLAIRIADFTIQHSNENVITTFHSPHTATKEQARELEVQVTEKLIEVINAHEKIRPFLVEYPFPAGRTNVIIYFNPPEDPWLEKDWISYVYQKNNEVFYRKDRPSFSTINKGQLILFNILKVEPYADALKIVQEKASPSRTP